MALDRKVQSSGGTSVRPDDQTKVQSDAGLWSHLTSRLAWRELSLSLQFLGVAAIVLFHMMVILGTWVGNKIEESALASSAAAAAVLMDSYLEPFVQNLNDEGQLPPEDAAALDDLFADTLLGRHTLAIKIWKLDGTVVYSTDKVLVGQTFEVNNVRRTVETGMTATFEDAGDEESARQHTFNVPMMEIYFPLYDVATGGIIAVGEFYQEATSLRRTLDAARRDTWLVVGLVTFATLALLYLIVRQGSRTIVAQRAELRAQVAERTSLAQQNEFLRHEADRARLEASRTNEEWLSRIGSDLHDGPVQLLSLVMLRLPSRRANAPDLKAADAEELRQLTAEALSDLRAISTGLVLPEIADLCPADTVRLAVRRHEETTGTLVDLQIGELPEKLSHGAKIGIYRVVQEGLTNAFKHAGGQGQAVLAEAEGGGIEIIVRDGGPGMTAPEGKSKHRQLGLAGLRSRLSALKGRIDVVSSAHGTVLEAWIPADSGDEAPTA